MEELEPYMVVSIGGLLIGIVAGATIHLTNFCTMGGISDRVLMDSGNRLRAWMLATAVAIIGTQYLSWSEAIDLSQAIYTTPNLGWLGAIIGGLLFGYGMTRASGCSSKNLARVGSGSLKSLIVVMIVAFVGYMTLRGLIGPLRLQIETSNLALDGSGIESQKIGDILAGITGMAAETWHTVVMVLLPLAILAWCFKSAEYRSSKRHILGGVIIGLCVVAGWYVTGVLGADDFDPVPLESMTFVAPSANAMQYLMTWTGSTINFGIALVGGVIVGAFLASISTGTFHIEGFANSDDTRNHIIGAVMMGFGGVLALGCSVGQGVTGMSTLSAGSLIALLSIMAGGYLGIKQLEEGTFGGALKAAFSRA